MITVLSTGDRDADQLSDYRGLGARRPVLAAIFAVALFSLAGMPLTMGFIGKFVIVAAGAGAALWALVIVLVVTSTIGLYYYTRLIVVMYVRRPEELELAARPAAAARRRVLAALTAVLLASASTPAALRWSSTPSRRALAVGARRCGWSSTRVSVLPWP